MAEAILGDGVSSHKIFAVFALVFLNAGAAFSADKLIAHTFDDGPRPFCVDKLASPNTSPVSLSRDMAGTGNLFPDREGDTGLKLERLSVGLGPVKR